jgi:hypothetical protein
MKQSPPKAVLISEKYLLNRWRSLRFALTILGVGGVGSVEESVRIISFPSSPSSLNLTTPKPLPCLKISIQLSQLADCSRSKLALQLM